MKKILFVFAVAALLAGPALAQTAAEHIAAGDAAYAAFDDAKALEHYQAALKLEPANYEALWKASRAMVDIADIIPATDKDVKERQQKILHRRHRAGPQGGRGRSEGHLGPFPAGRVQRQAAPHARQEGADQRLEGGPGRDRQGHRARSGQPPRLSRPGTLAPQDGRDRRRQALLRQHRLRLDPERLLRGVREGPAQGHRAPPRIPQPLPRARPDAPRPQEDRRSRGSASRRPSTCPRRPPRTTC